MKKILLYVLGMICWHSVYSQPKMIKGPSGQVIAFECSEGNIKNVNRQPVNVVRDTLGIIDTLLMQGIEEVNANAVTLITIQDGQTITDPSGAIIAAYNPTLKELRDVNNHLLFRLNETNQILNSSDMVIGWIDETGNVFGNDSNKIAEAPGVEPYKLAYLFFYANK